jgi:hypothetical protein
MIGTGCSTVSAYSSTTTYWGGDKATYGSRELNQSVVLVTSLTLLVPSAKHVWTAQWWTLGEAPGANLSDPPPWQDSGAC